MTRRPARIGLSFMFVAVVTLVALGAAVPVAGVGPAMRLALTDERPAGPAAARPFVLDLYRRGDFVAQATLVQCVGASMQMMLNMTGPVDDRTPATQRRLFDLARSLRDPSVAGNRAWKGASAGGWALGLTKLGAGPYRLVAPTTIEEALTVSARAISRTRKPVGLLVWQGRHAWVMSGFEATADPAADPAARILAVRVLDPLYPRVSSRWGRSPAPGARLTPAQLSRVFVPWRPNSRNAALRGRFVLVLPFDPAAVGGRGPRRP